MGQLKSNSKKKKRCLRSRIFLHALQETKKKKEKKYASSSHEHLATDVDFYFPVVW